jgi:hypothetical protein
MREGWGAVRRECAGRRRWRGVSFTAGGALALALEPVEDIGIHAQRKGALDGAIEGPANRFAPIRDRRHFGGVYLTLRHCGKSIQLGLQMRRERLWITSLHSLASHGLPPFLR